MNNLILREKVIVLTKTFFGGVSMKDKIRVFFQPIKIGKVEIPNRFFMAPMALPVECDENGAFTDKSIEYYVQRAKGGTGLIITGANWVENEVEPHAPCIFPCPTTMPNLYEKKARELTERVHAFGSKIFCQLTAGLGRSAIPGFVPPDRLVAPSEIHNRWIPELTCRELKTEEVEKIVEKFGEAAEIVKKSGFDGIEVHAIHEGYLLDCFAMSFFNKRTDKYGGDLRGRLTFAIEIVKKIKEVCGEDFPVILRFSIKSYVKDYFKGALPGETFEEKGRDIEEALEAAKILQDAGYDAFDADAGTYDSWYWAHPPMYFEKGIYLPLAKRLKEVAKVPVMVAGRMDDIEKSAQALIDGIIDMMGLGRPLLADPEFVNKVRTNQIDQIRPCLGCHDGCFGRVLEGGQGSCTVNPECGREIAVGIKKADSRKKVVVVGGGPAGMEAARVSALRGYDVILFEASDKLGGALLAASAPDFKEDERNLIAWYEGQLKKLGVDIRLNTKADKATIDAIKPDIIYVAEGSRPIVPSVDGIEKAVLAQDVLLGKVEAKDNVAVIGGGLVGCELALHLAKQGKKVTIVEALHDILSSGIKPPPMNEWMLRDLLAFYKVEIKTGRSLSSVTDEGAVVTGENGTETIPCEQVIIAVGYKPERSLYDELKYDYAYVYNLGDSKEVRNIRGAIWDAYEVARSL